ncbi:MAG: aldehyde dehydrogenase family protein, partial [Salinibacter sp.]
MASRSSSAPSTDADPASVLSRLRAHAPTVRRTSAAQRTAKLRRLADGLQARRDTVVAALRADFRKAPVEVDLTEIKAVTKEADHAIAHLEDWMAPDRVSAPFFLAGTRSEVHYEPKGVVLIMAPWNYPVTLTLGPLIGAIAAGNCAVLKPSEHAPCTAAVLQALIGDLFDEREISVVPGGPDVAEALTTQPFDHIYFTGSPAIGRRVMRAAAEHLTSVTLELGGKSPAVVDGTADLDRAAGRIAWSKFTNAGQTCIAPDYVIAERRVHDALV